MTDLQVVAISRADAMADAAEAYLTAVGERQARLGAKALWAALASYYAARGVPVNDGSEGAGTMEP